MSPEFFNTQWQRLVNHFGDRAMNPEFRLLAAREVRDMPESEFQRTVDVWIGSRPHTKPPLIPDFRDARLAVQKRRFEEDVRGASNFLKKRAPEEMRKHLRAILSKEFGAVESVSEALEVARLRYKVAQADNDDGPEAA